MLAPHLRTMSLPVFLAFVIVAANVAMARAECPEADYRPGAILVDSESTLYMAVSIRWRDFAPPRLVCLAAALKQRYHDRKTVEVHIFSSQDAARFYTGGPPAEGTAAPPSNANEARRHNYFWQIKQLHGRYLFDAAKQTEYLEIKPLGSGRDLPYDTRIVLPTAVVPHCTNEINNRCLLAIDEPTYPGGYADKTSGSVSLSATVLRDGRIAHVQVITSTSMPLGRAETLVREAIGNLKTWRLEEASVESTFRTTYSYGVDRSLQRGQVDVQLALPSQVTIHVSP